MSQVDTKLAERLVELLTRLVQGQVLEPEKLMHEFDVTRKTIDRDLKERLGSVTRSERQQGKVVYVLDNVAWVWVVDLHAVSGKRVWLGMKQR